MLTGKNMLHQKKVTQAEIIAALNSGATVVTANKRLAAVSRQVFEKDNIDKGLEVWPTAKILPWTVWLQNTWEEAVISGVLPAPKLLLTQQQEQYIWKDIITEAFVDNPLQQVSGTARQAQQAWQLVQAWQLKLDTATFNYNSDSAAFKQWAATFELLCEDKNWLSMARLIDKLQSCAQQGKLAVADELVLFGFDELAPQQQSFLQTLVESGCTVSWLQLAGLQSQMAAVGCSDARHEAETAARWVRQCIDENPEATIGIVVPELQAQRNIIMQIFDQVLLPPSLSLTEHSVPRPYNVSLGLPLSSYPIIDTALRLLGLLAPTISLQDAGMLLRSPFIRGWQQEASARSLLDACLRKNVGELEISLKTLRVYANQTAKPHACPELVKNIDAWSEAANTCRQKHGPGQWSEKFACLLTAFGWASGRALSSEEYQATEAWRDLLISFACLDAVTQSMAASIAVTQLRSMAKDRTYQPETGDLPIQLLGVLEADQQQFDYLWVMGLHDGVWPSPPRPNPFIPVFIQRDAGLPHSSEDRQLQLARAATESWLVSAAQVIVSYPKRHGDEELRVSSLIKNVDEVELESLKLYQALTWSEQVHQSAKLDRLELDPAPALESEDAKGGSSILTHQANCPFRAFAELRLGARALEQADIGLNAMVKGSLLHTILEKVWQRLESQENLLLMEPSNLKILVAAITNETIQAIAYRYPQTFTERFRLLESERLCLRVMQWLALEKERQPFKVIEMEDRDKYQANAGGVKIKVIIDRIDELEDGRKLVIDYKTGSVAPAQWFGERPEAPQLPLYSMVVEGNVAAVAFAQVKAGEMAFKGVAEEGGVLPAVKSYEQLKYTNKETWGEVLEEWQQTMEKLGEAYRNGDAAIDPKHKSKTCENTYCNLKSLCRINELTTLDGVSAEMEEQL
jgi:ATP-dependent helicase/nuclease subunit B